jgi:hypothetical protein
MLFSLWVNSWLEPDGVAAPKRLKKNLSMAISFGNFLLELYCLVSL